MVTPKTAVHSRYNAHVAGWWSWLGQVLGTQGQTVRTSEKTAAAGLRVQTSPFPGCTWSLAPWLWPGSKASVETWPRSTVPVIWPLALRLLRRCSTSSTTSLECRMWTGERKKKNLRCFEQRRGEVTRGEAGWGWGVRAYVPACASVRVCLHGLCPVNSLLLKSPTKSGGVVTAGSGIKKPHEEQKWGGDRILLGRDWKENKRFRAFSVSTDKDLSSKRFVFVPVFSPKGSYHLTLLLNLKSVLRSACRSLVWKDYFT